MSYIRPEKGYVPGPGIPGPLWHGDPPRPQHGLGIFGWSIIPEPETVETGVWADAIRRIEAGESVPPEDLPEEAPPPEVYDKLPSDVQRQYPEPSFFDRYKSFIVAGGVLAGFLWWRGRKKRR